MNWWTGWPLHRAVVLFDGFAFLVIFVQVTLFHYRQNFRHWAMWGPVIGAPLIGLFALVMALTNARLMLWPTIVLMAVGLVEGLMGTYLHIRGVGQRVDGYKLQNFLIGPPATLPLMVSALSVLGLLGLGWR